MARQQLQFEKQTSETLANQLRESREDQSKAHNDLLGQLGSMTIQAGRAADASSQAQASATSTSRPPPPSQSSQQQPSAVTQEETKKRAKPSPPKYNPGTGPATPNMPPTKASRSTAPRQQVPSTPPPVHPPVPPGTNPGDSQQHTQELADSSRSIAPHDPSQQSDATTSAQHDTDSADHQTQDAQQGKRGPPTPPGTPIQSSHKHAKTEDIDRTAAIENLAQELHHQADTGRPVAHNFFRPDDTASALEPTSEVPSDRDDS